MWHALDIAEAAVAVLLHCRAALAVQSRARYGRVQRLQAAIGTSSRLSSGLPCRDLSMPFAHAAPKEFTCLTTSAHDAEYMGPGVRCVTCFSGGSSNSGVRLPFLQTVSNCCAKLPTTGGWSSAFGAGGNAAQYVFVCMQKCRQQEDPQRPVNVFCLDVSKQAFSSGAAHVCGMIIAIIAHFGTSQHSPSECAWYFVVFSADTSLGVALAIGLHNVMLRFCQRWADTGRKGAAVALAISACGDYGE